jgi:IclR family acetate operon transcriptional repressor
LISLARQVNENVETAVFSGREVVVVDQVASPARLQGVTQVGKSFSLHASAIGMALLAKLPGEQVDALLSSRLERFTDKTVSERSAVLLRLEQIRLCGVAIDVEEHDVGICAAATALVGPTGVLQAVAVVVPTHRFHGKAPQIVASLCSLNPEIDKESALRQLK